MGKKILLLENDKQFAKLVVPVLEGRGHKVIQADTANQGSHLLESERFNLVILCGPLPDNDIAEWISKLRSQGKNVRIVLVAPSSQEAEILQSKLAKGSDISLIVHKPIVPFVFGAQVERQLSNDNEDVQRTKWKDFDTMFLALVSKYARVLPSKLDELALSIQKAKDGSQNSAAVAQIKDQAHKIKGTAGSLGFRQVAEAMAFIEESAINISNKNSKAMAASLTEMSNKLVDAKTISISESQELAKLVAEKPKETAPTPSLARILVVDDDREFLDIVENLGKQRMVEILRAENFAQALDQAYLYPIDAALISIQSDSPESSFTIARELRGLPGYENLPLALISSNALTKDRIEATHAGASLYLDKPLESKSLEAAVEHLVSIRQGGRPKILIVDDDEFFANTVALVLRTEGMLVRILLDPGKILDQLQEFPPDVLLLDVAMPQVNGFEVCRMLRQIPRWQDLPIIFLTGQTGVDTRLESFRSGGDDYLPKPVVNEELLTRVQVRLDRSRLLKERSDKDTVSGLLLRRAFSEQLSGVIAEAKRLNSQFTICLLDLDHFKNVNDNYGHLAGDRVIAGLGHLLSKRFRVDDLRGRWGGEEFILAFRRESKETMQKVVARLAQEFSAIKFTSDSGQEFSISFSGGLATFPEDGDSVYELLRTADSRLYRAKELGRKRLVVSDDE